MFCTNCGNSLMESDKFCAQCGKANAPGPGGAPYQQYAPYARPVFERAMATHKIAGVCGGLARYFDLDVTLVRAIFVLGIFVHGITLLPYLVLWAVMQRDDCRPITTSAPRAA
jgi:phage shock protein C